MREVEEYSTSETEEVSVTTVAKENEKPNKEPVKEVKTKESPINAKTNKKQGSIMSFFSKK